MIEGKLLGHIVSTEGIKIDPERVKAILKISIPRNKKEIQSFIGKINFLRWFIPNFAEIIKHITEMLKKVLRHGNLQATTVRDSPQSTFPISP